MCALSLTDRLNSVCCWLSDHHHLRSAQVSLQCNLINLTTQQHSVAGGNGFGSLPLLLLLLLYSAVGPCVRWLSLLMMTDARTRELLLPLLYFLLLFRCLLLLLSGSGNGALLFLFSFPFFSCAVVSSPSPGYAIVIAGE